MFGLVQKHISGSQIATKTVFIGVFQPIDDNCMLVNLDDINKT